MDLNLNTWIETWNDNKVQSSEGYNFNTSGNDWLGGGNISGDGWAWQSTRVEYAAGTVSGAKVDTTKYPVTSETVNSATVYSYTNSDSEKVITDAHGYLIHQDDNGNNIAYYTEVNKNGSYDTATGEVVWDFISARDNAYQDNGDFWGEYLGGYDVDGGTKVSFDGTWGEIGREVNTDSLKTLASDAVIPDFVADATHASYKNYASDYPAKADLDQTDTALLASYDLFVAEGPQNGEVQYYEELANGTYTPLGKVNNWSWFNEGDGNWGVGSNYDKYDDTNGDWPWQWVGQENTHYWDGNVDKSSQVRIDNDDGTYTEKGSNDNQWDTSSFEWLYDSTSYEFLGGTETRDGTTVKYDKHWNVLETQETIADPTALKTLGSSEFAALIADNGGTADDVTDDFVFKYFDVDDLAAAVGETFKTTLVSKGIVTESNYASDKQSELLTEVKAGVSFVIKHEDSSDDGSWANKRVNLIINDDNGTASDTSDDTFKTLGKMDLNLNTWIETWNDNKVQSSEGYNFNTSGNDWLGGGNISGDGWAWQSTRVEYAAGTVSGAKVDTTKYPVTSETVNSATVYSYTNSDSEKVITDAHGYLIHQDDNGNNIAYYTEVNKNGSYDTATGEVVWDFISARDNAYQDNGDFWGEYLGGYDVDGGTKVSFDGTWGEIGREVNTDSLKTLASDAVIPDFVADATHASYKNYASDYPAKADLDQTDAALLASYDLFCCRGPSEWGSSVLRRLGQSGTYTPLGKVNNWSWFNEGDGNWGVGSNYDKYDDTNGDWPWQWVGRENTHYWDGNVDESSQVRIDNGDGTYTEKGSFQRYSVGRRLPSNGFTIPPTYEFLGGTETRDGTTVKYDKHWNVLETRETIADPTALKTLGSSEFAALIADNGGTAGDATDDFVFQYFDALMTWPLAVAETFKTTLVAKGIVTSSRTMRLTSSLSFWLRCRRASLL